MSAEDAQVAEPTSSASLRKRKPKRGGKGGNTNKRMKAPPSQYQGSSKKVRETKKSRRLIRKRAREYNSDDDEDTEGDKEVTDDASDEDGGSGEEEGGDEGWDADVEKGYEKGSSDEDEGDGMEQGTMKLVQGCRAFKTAFSKIMKKSSAADPLGPVLSAHKKLVAEKLAEEVAEQKVKGEAKKEKHALVEKGHIQPANYLDSKEKFLISVATKGVVKLFNAVNKAQNSQKGLNPSKSKDAKELAKRRKQTFLSELRKPTMQTKSGDEDNDGEPGWAPLRDNYMLTSSKLKDWDKMEVSAAAGSPKRTPLESSSDED